MKKFLALVLVAIFSIAMLSMSVSAADVLWLQNADNGPIFGIFQQDEEHVWSGTYSGKASGGQGLYVGAASFEPVDVSGYEYVHINLYVENASDVGSDYVYFELSSAAACDVMEIEWRFEGTIVDGWNHLVAKMSDGSKYDPDGGEIDLTAINYTRAVIQSPAGAPVWIDGMFFSNSASNVGAGNAETGVESAVAVACAAVLGAASLLVISRKK